MTGEDLRAILKQDVEAKLNACVGTCVSAGRDVRDARISQAADELVAKEALIEETKKILSRVGQRLRNAQNEQDSARTSVDALFEGKKDLIKCVEDVESTLAQLPRDLRTL